MKRTTPFAAAAAAVVLLLTACADDTDNDDPGGGDPTAQEGFPVTIGDVTLEQQPARIVSLSPTATEMLYAIGAGDQVVAVDEYSNYPEDAPTTDLSGFDFSPEAVADYDPDLVVLSAFAEGIVPQLEELNIPAHVAPDTVASLDEVYEQIIELGVLTGQDEAAGELVGDMSEQLATTLAAAPERDEPLTYYIEIDDTLWTYTSESLVAKLFAEAGLANVIDGEGEVTTQVSAEALIDADPDIIFLINAEHGVTPDEVVARDGWSTITAVEQGAIVDLDGDIASRWGPRIVDLVGDAVDAAAQAS